MRKTCDAAAGLKFIAENPLVQYRAESLLTKEPETIAWIDGELRSGDVLLDVGANVGVYALYAAARHRDCRVYAVEPFLPNFICLCDNVQLNGLDNIVPLFLGFSDRTGIEPLFVRDDRTGASGSQIGHSLDESGKPFEPLSMQQTLVYSVDEFLQTVGVPVPHHVKIDVDGNEEKIVRGMSDTLATGGLRSLLIEVNVALSDVGSLVRVIEAHGFTRENRYNSLSDHSRNRRARTAGNVVENVVFTRF